MATQTYAGSTEEERRHPSEPENLPCPRCDSTNTKFCYYNNYNLSQPRYFCKSCRRYWTRGGTLRNVPVGGGTRKKSKRRSRPSSSSSSPSVGSTLTPPPPLMETDSMLLDFHKVGKNNDMDLNVNEGSFTSLLTTNTNASTYGIGIGLGYGFGLGPSSYYNELSFGLGASRNAGGDETQAQQIAGVQNGGNNAWQFSGGEDIDGAGCFGWPDLAI